MIPAIIRKEMGIREGTELVVRFAEGSLQISTKAEGIRRAKELCRSLSRPGKSVVDEFLKERREAAIQEFARAEPKRGR